MSIKTTDILFDINGVYGTMTSTKSTHFMILDKGKVAVLITPIFPIRLISSKTFSLGQIIMLNV